MAKLIDDIRAAIEASDMTAYQIAHDANVARSQLSRLLSGESGLSVDCAERVAGALGYTIELRPIKRSKTARKSR